MTVSLLDIRYLFLLVALAQCVSLYRINPYADDQFDLTSSSINERLNSLIQDQDLGFDNGKYNFLNGVHKDENDADPWQLRHKRTVSGAGLIPTPQRRTNRPHWNPLVAAYKRCGEFISPEKRESCFKDAIQMLFVHKLRK